jgi:hypothetical protein
MGHHTNRKRNLYSSLYWAFSSFFDIGYSTECYWLSNTIKPQWKNFGDLNSCAVSPEPAAFQLKIRILPFDSIETVARFDLLLSNKRICNSCYD